MGIINRHIGDSPSPPFFCEKHTSVIIQDEYGKKVICPWCEIDRIQNEYENVKKYYKKALERAHKYREKWLSAIGYKKPTEEELQRNLNYNTLCIQGDKDK